MLASRVPFASKRQRVHMKAVLHPRLWRSLHQTNMLSTFYQRGLPFGRLRPKVPHGKLVCHTALTTPLGSHEFPDWKWMCLKRTACGFWCRSLHCKRTRLNGCPAKQPILGVGGATAVQGDDAITIQMSFHGVKSLLYSRRSSIQEWTHNAAGKQTSTHGETKREGERQTHTHTQTNKQTSKQTSKQANIQKE